MVGVHDIRQRLTEHVEVDGIAVAFEEEHVIWIDGADGLSHPVVEGLDALLRRVSGLVQHVVASHPGIRAVMLGEAFPKPDRAVLKKNSSGCPEPSGADSRVPSIESLAPIEPRHW
jgi:hypothetical protein